MAATHTSIERSITIGATADELYRCWREPHNLRQIMGAAAEVTATSADRAHWLIHAPLGQQLEWDTQVIEDRPGELIRWESLPDAAVPNTGALRFRPAPRDWGTEVTLSFAFDPPGKILGDAAAKLLGIVPETLAATALRRFKSLVETGEIPTTEHQPAARERGRDE